MKNLWSDADAEAAAAKYARYGRDFALRLYTTRLLGSEPRLVLHGGGNTSVKTVVKDILGDEVEVLCVKGSGWDMGTIEPPGLPAVLLEPAAHVLAGHAAAQAAGPQRLERRGHGQRATLQPSRQRRPQSLG